MKKSDEFYHQELNAQFKREKITAISGVLALLLAAAIYPLSGLFVNVALVAVAGLIAFVAINHFKHLSQTIKGQLRLFDAYTGYVDDVLKVFPDCDQQAITAVCSRDFIGKLNTLQRQTLFMLNEDDFVLVGLGYYGTGDEERVINSAVKVEQLQAITLFEESQEAKAKVSLPRG